MASTLPKKDNSGAKHLFSIVIVTLFTFVILSSSQAKAAPAMKNLSVLNKSGPHVNLIYDHDQYSSRHQHERVSKSSGIFSEATSQRVKRSPYPPGFVTWGWSEPCFCPPGASNCRCYSRSVSTKSDGKTSSSSKPKKRVARSRKNKF